VDELGAIIKWFLLWTAVFTLPFMACEAVTTPLG
jgi:hypothetical protein